MYRDHFGDRIRSCRHPFRESGKRTDRQSGNCFVPMYRSMLAGGRKGLAGRHSSAFWGFLDVLKGMGSRRPPLVLIENVPGFLTSAGGKDLYAALRALNDLGYAADIFTLDAVHFVPQSRNRLFIVGQPRGLDRGTPAGRSAILYRSSPRHPVDRSSTACSPRRHLAAPGNTREGCRVVGAGTKRVPALADARPAISPAPTRPSRNGVGRTERYFDGPQRRQLWPNCGPTGSPAASYPARRQRASDLNEGRLRPVCLPPAYGPRMCSSDGRGRLRTRRAGKPGFVWFW